MSRAIRSAASGIATAVRSRWPIPTMALVAAMVHAASALATEPKQAGHFSESEMLEAARAAAAGGGGRTVNIGIPPADELRLLEARRETELKRLSDKLRRAEAARGPQPAEVLTPPPWTTDVVSAPPDDAAGEPRFGLGAGSSNTTVTDAEGLELRGHATVLMVMAPGEPTASASSERPGDPILCVADGCYVSNGPQAPATYHLFGQSVSLAGRLGRGAGACNRSTACVFRNVDLGLAKAMVQPIDLRSTRGDRRAPQEIVIDHTCRIIDSRLTCSRPARMAGYVLWVVPEILAREIGPDALVTAVDGGLQSSRNAELPWIRQ